MSSIELTASQRRILRALVDLHADREQPVKGEEIADAIDRNPGTIRNQMQSLKALQLVEGVPGPKGGYEPKAAAFEALDVDEIDRPADVPIYLDDEVVEGVTVEEIDLTSVHHPELCRAEIHVRGGLTAFDEGDSVRTGPTPLSKLVVDGYIEGLDEPHGILILEIESMRAPVDNPAY